MSPVRFLSGVGSGISALALGFAIAAAPIDFQLSGGVFSLKSIDAVAAKGSGKDGSGSDNSGRRGGRDRVDDNPTPGDDDGTPDQGPGDN